MSKIKVTADGTTVVVGDNDKVEINISGGGTVTIEADPTDAVDKIQIDFGNDGEADTAIIDLSTFSQDGLQIDLKDYDPTDHLVLQGGFDFYVDPANPDEYTFKYIGADGETYTGLARIKDGGEKDFFSDPKPIIICFASGTYIEVDGGWALVEDLTVGDMVMTQSRGLQPIRWIGRRNIDTMTLLAHPDLQPVQINAHAYGENQPFADLVLSPQHRVEVSDWRSELLFGTADVLTAVKHLIDGQRVVQLNVAEVSYHHILLDHHEILNSNGVASESLHSGDMANLAIGPEALAELSLIFPALMKDLQDRQTHGRVLRGFEAKALAQLSA